MARFQTILFFILLALTIARASLAGEAPGGPTPSASPAPAGPGADTPSLERVNVESIQEKYWARGDESELGVVQNRLYSNAHKIELGIYGGFVSSDPFLTVRNVGLSAAYHFNEYIAAEVLWWREYASASSALQIFEQREGATTNYNAPQAYYGGEAVGSILYGKLSLIGKAIIYYDLHLLGGLGVTLTDNGNYATEHLGIGQQVYLNRFTALRIDYRAMHYSEHIIEKVIPTLLGTDYGTRDNWSHVITLGFSFSLGGARAAEVERSAK